LYTPPVHALIIHGVGVYPENAGVPAIETVIGQLIGDQHNDSHTYCHAHGKAENIDGREKFIPRKVAEGNQKVIPDHTIRFLLIPTSYFLSNSFFITK
jgi:hypothetical protein